jgi:hypothetical protein
VIFSDIAITQFPDNAFNSIITTGNDGLMKIIEDSSSARKLEVGVSGGQIAITNNANRLFFGITDAPGNIRCYNFAPLSGEYYEFPAH